MHVRFLAVVLLIVSTLVISTPPSEARSDTRVKGYVKKGAKPVSSHKRKSPNKSKLDNYGTKGNVNPHAGKVGNKVPFVTGARR